MKKRKNSYIENLQGVLDRLKKIDPANQKSFDLKNECLKRLQACMTKEKKMRGQISSVEGVLKKTKKDLRRERSGKNERINKDE